MSKLPLEGIRVVELTTGAAGPTVRGCCANSARKSFAARRDCAVMVTAVKTQSCGTRSLIS